MYSSHKVWWISWHFNTYTLTIFSSYDPVLSPSQSWSPFWIVLPLYLCPSFLCMCVCVCVCMRYICMCVYTCVCVHACEGALSSIYEKNMHSCFWLCLTLLTIRVSASIFFPTNGFIFLINHIKPLFLHTILYSKRLPVPRKQYKSMSGTQGFPPFLI